MSDQPNIVGRAVQDFEEWVKAIDGALSLGDEQKAYAVLRGVMHQLRDRMPMEEAIHLGAQLPTLVRGVYYETFTPGAPEKERDETAFLTRVAERIRRDDVDPEAATRAVFAVLRDKCDPGQIAQVVHIMPDEIKPLLR
ncbi:DUF2267 domain-containing protein [Acuticoccus sp.]|uniref:DUF2267 domain-containing protein n=1 Tax=Acuticoccus sp. TaxID=1904378 RepID=UPI003B51A393